MDQHRTRRRPQRRGRSALLGITLSENSWERLNTATPNVTSCAWPQCRDPLVMYVPGGDPLVNRYGVLCQVHAADVAIAVIQHEASLNIVKGFFDRQTTEKAIRAAAWRAEDERYEADKAAVRGDREGFVYYLQVGERLKVGYSADVKKRMRQYPPGSELLAVEPGDLELERSRHQQFAGSRRDGREWFNPTEDLLEHIAALVAEHGEPDRFAYHYRKNQQPMRLRRSA